MIAYHFHKKCFSIRSRSSRKVIGYTDRIVLSNARFLVSQSGRARVLRERMKNIHAYVQGEFMHELQHAEFPIAYVKEAYYNPYRVSTFVDKGRTEPIHFAPIAICEQGKVYYGVGNWQ